MSMSRTRFKLVWGAIERHGKTFWTRIGLSWEAKDGTQFAQLNAFPLSGRIAIKDGYDEAAEAALTVEEAVQ